MSIRLRVTPAELTAAASEMKASAEGILRDMAEADDAASSCAGFWEGEAFEKHRNDYEMRKEQMEKAAKALSALPDHLLAMAGIYTSAEESAESLAGVLNTEILV